MKKQIILYILCCIFCLTSFMSYDSYAQKTEEISFYCVAPPFVPLSKVAVKMKEKFENDTDKTFKMKLFTAGQLGDQSSALNNLASGVINTAAIDALIVTSIEPKVNALLLPYAFNTWEDVETIANGKALKIIGQSLEKKGIKLLGVGLYGFSNIFSINDLKMNKDNLQGLKIRVTPAPILVDWYNLLGAKPTPIAFSETYTALQQGIVDASDSTLDACHASKQYEVAKYLTRTKHRHGWFLYIGNKKWIDNLPDKTRTKLETEFSEFCGMQRKMARLYEDEMLKFFQDKGITVKELTDNEREELKKDVLKLHDLYRKTIGNDLIDQFYSEIDFTK